eukprot:103425-Pleurochrysis_carterae.AAC.4
MVDLKTQWPELAGKPDAEAEAIVKEERPDVSVQVPSIQQICLRGDSIGLHILVLPDHRGETCVTVDDRNCPAKNAPMEAVDTMEDTHHAHAPVH